MNDKQVMFNSKWCRIILEHFE